MIARRQRSAESHATHGFTLTELLVVMGVITVLATLTVIGIRGVARNARLASGTNAVMAALDTARAVAMKENTIVLVVFRPRLSADRRKQRVEIVIARWTGEAATAEVPGASVVPDRKVVDRFVPVPGLAFRELPRGIKVAGPLYGDDLDEYWVTQTHLPVLHPVTGLGEVAGQLIAVMYAPDGSTITRNSRTDSVRTFVDFNNNGCQDFGNAEDHDCDETTDINYNMFPVISAQDFNETFFDQRFEGEETYVVMVPFVAVYDDEKARELRTTDDWTNQPAYDGDLTGPEGYITLRADRIHFNRYTGVAMK